MIMKSVNRAKLLPLGVLLALSVAAVGATLWAAPADPESNTSAATTQWEFAAMKVPVDKSTQEVGSQILKLGREGWELVSVENFVKDGTTTETAYYFKRPR
jgi:hypothetical protein